jgi:hypothetical protein
MAARMNSDFITEDLTTDGHGWTRIYFAKRSRRRDSVLECGGPPPLFRRRFPIQSAKGLAHSKTWRLSGWGMKNRGEVRLSLEQAGGIR